MLDIKVETFLTVCQEMNFTKASRVLNISQPAVSQHIRNLEEYYGVSLFIFEGKRFRLTRYGQLIRDSLTSMQNNDRYLKEQIHALKDNVHIINMGATLTVGEFLIARPVSRYARSHPGANISVMVTNTRELLEKLDTGIIDFAVLEGDYRKSAYAHRTFLRADFIPVCSKTHVFPQKNLTLQDLTKERLIIREPGSGTRMILESSLDHYSIKTSDFKNVITIGNMNAIIDMVLEDCGITFLYQNAVSARLSSGLLRQIPVPEFPMEHEISIIWKKDNMQSGYLLGLICELFNLDPEGAGDDASF